MSKNMPILWQNCLEQFETEIAKKAWVWFAENRGKDLLYDADAYALEVDKIVKFLAVALPMANEPFQATDETIGDLLSFILKRHANYRIGGNIHPTFLPPT